MKMTQRVRTKRYWYFATQDFMGHKMQLHPRLPHSAGEEEPVIKRICVAPTAAHCMSAVMFCGCNTIYVYRTRRRVFASKAWSVGDSDITHEHFLLRPSQFELVAAISPMWVEKMAERGAFDDRGGSKSGSKSGWVDGWHNQRHQRDMLVREVKKLDRRLAIMSESDIQFRFKYEGMLIGGEWPDAVEYVNSRESELELLGFRPPPTPVAIKSVPDQIRSPYLMDYDVCQTYQTPIKQITLQGGSWFKPQDNNKNLANSV